MHFDVIVGNPPYQLSDGGGTGSSAMPIYQYFVQQAKKLDPRYISFIIPARWFAGGKGLDNFREEMLNDRRISKIFDYPDAGECFPGVEIKGGVCYFIWDKSHNGECKITTINNDNKSSSLIRPLNEWDVLIRWNEAVPILRKVQSFHEETLDKNISARRPFDFSSNYNNYDQINNPDKVKIYLLGGKTGYVNREKIQTGKEYVDTIKILIAKAGSVNGTYPNNIIGSSFIVEPPSICTETFLIAGIAKTMDEAENYLRYLRTRFARFLLMLRTPTQNMSKTCFSFIPNLPMNQEWTDEKLYKRYGITEKEQQFIESLVKEM